MNFEILEKFDWYNDPENVRFEIDGMKVFAKSNTDFWCCLHRGYKKDNGHFFFCRENGDFEFVLRWKLINRLELSQCGVMVRIDERNWVKAGVECVAQGNLELFSCLTNLGHTDWTKSLDLGKIEEIWFKILRIGDEYGVFYSLDGENFVKFKMFYLKRFEDVKVGAYICSLSDDEFVAELGNLSIDEIEN